MSRRLQQFTEEFKNVKLEEFYQLPNTTSEILRVNFRSETTHSLKLFIYYEKGYACPNFDLPKELLDYIKGYLPDIVQIELTLTIPENNYPFNPHIWEVVRATSTKCKVETYSNLIKEHNSYNNADWSPVISIQSDVLCIIEKLYDYLYVPENKFINIDLNTIRLIIYNETII